MISVQCCIFYTDTQSNTVDHSGTLLVLYKWFWLFLNEPEFGDRWGGVNPRSRFLSCTSPSSSHDGLQPMPKTPKSKRKNDAPNPVGALSKYFPVDSIPSEDTKCGPPPPDPAREEEAERLFLSHNDERGFRMFANLYTMVYLAKPRLVQGIPFHSLIVG
jgi:hypothetical protein